MNTIYKKNKKLKNFRRVKKDMENLIKKLEKLKNSFKKDCSAEIILSDINDAKRELDSAMRSFNETTKSEYIDIAILNLNLAKKKYDIKLKEARAFFEEKKAI